MMNNELSWSHDNKKELWQAISNAQIILDSRMNRDVNFGVVYFEVNEGHLVIKLTQLDNMLIQQIPINNTGTGSFLVSLPTLYEILKNLPDSQELNFVLKDQQVHITYPDGNFQILCVDKDRQMVFTKADIPVMYDIPAIDLYKVLNQVSGFMGDDNTCIYLNGVYMCQRDDSIVFVATDAHRLLHKKIFNDRIKIREVTKNTKFLIPRKVVIGLQRLLYNNLSRDVSISFKEQQIHFKIENILFVSNALDGEFPDYESVLLDIKQAQESLSITDSAKFLQILNRVMCLAQQKSSMINMQINASESSWITLREPGIGTAKEMIPLKNAAQDRNVDFNGRYLWEMIKCADSPNIWLHFYAKDSQVLFTIDDDLGFIGLLMPMNSI